MGDSALEKPLLGGPGGGFKIFSGIGSVQKRLIYATAFCLVFTLVEVVVGIFSNSLALISDASHLISDICSYLISLFGLHLSKRKATTTMSFGYNRAEILGALLSILLIWIMTIMLVYEAIQRIFNPVEVDGFSMFVTAIFGILSNLFISFVLSVHNHGMGSLGAGCTHRFPNPNKDSGRGQSQSRFHGHDQNHPLISNASAFSPEDKEIGQKEKGEYPSGGVRTGTQNKDANNEITDVYSGLSHSPVLRRVNSSFRTGNYDCGPEDCDHELKKTHSHHPSERESLALRSAYIHVIGDVLQNVGVMLAGLCIWFSPSWTIADPLCTILFSFFVLATTIRILKDSTNVLMEGTPIGIDCVSIQNDFLKISSVLEVHDLHIWSLSVGVPALSCHIVVDSEESARITLRYATDLCQNKYGIFHTTIQIDYTQNKLTCGTIHHQKCFTGSSSLPRDGHEVPAIGYSA
ncbi:putative cation efflux family protein [Cryptosporidium felis]|nr:putative cation efflux family protein [Cryptosporidium felis]